MAISVSSIYTNVSGAVKRYGIKAFDAIPTMQIKGKAIDALRWSGKEISSAENRLILGVTALASQPFIDLNNKKVDEKTRIISCAKTLAKIIAGTLTGVIIRKGCIKVVQKFPLIFDPKSLDLDVGKYKQYQNAMGTVLGIFVMLYTNFAIDMPLTKYLTNYFNDRFQKKGGKQ